MGCIVLARRDADKLESFFRTRIQIVGRHAHMPLQIPPHQQNAPHLQSIMAIDFSSTTGLPEDAAEAGNARLPAAAPILEPGAPTDLQLMHGIQAEDPEALSQLYDRYNGIIKALILRVIHNEAEADDLLQEIFMEIWNQAKNFSPQKGKPLGWMVTLARRRAIDGLRKKQAYARAGERLQTETEQQPDAWVHNATEEEITFGDTRVLVRQVIDTLPVAQQEAINLAFFRGMSQREIAAQTNTPLGTVKTRLELGLKKIYDGLKELRDEL
jgi:RNA polymerase sigma-70 factor (ECF subfamily)